MSGLMRKIKGMMMRHVHGMITCREFEEFILAYMEGELPEKNVKRFEWHLRTCRECREYLAAYKRTMEVGKACLESTSEVLPEDVPEDLITAILDARDR